MSDSFLCSSDLGICAHSKVSWHLLAMSSEPELFSVHFNGQVLLQYGHKTSAVGIISGTATSASMNAVHPGRWLFSSYISKHLEGKSARNNTRFMNETHNVYQIVKPILYSIDFIS